MWVKLENHVILKQEAEVKKNRGDQAPDLTRTYLRQTRHPGDKAITHTMLRDIEKLHRLAHSSRGVDAHHKSID